ncbi:MAG: hypothetical protein ACTHKG_05070 [Nocardioides sp.]
MLNWQQADPARTERAIQALLRKLYPGLRSFDGAGGDGGRDAELVTADGRTVFEVKSFRRFGSSQRRQVERSLKKAVQSVPAMVRWVLVVPINMTPKRPGARSSEEAWFDDKLPTLAPGVDLAWWGLDWLDAQVAEHLEFQRYIEGADAQLLERARQFDKESAVLAGGIGDLHERLHGLRNRVDELSMFWTLDFEVRGGVTHSTLRAKQADAHILDPITITPTFSFNEDDPDDAALRAKVERTLGFGGTIDLPAGYITKLDIDASDETRKLFDTGRNPGDSEFTFHSPRVKLDRHLRCAYQMLDAEDRVVAGFPVFLRERTAGATGVTLYGSDAAGIVSFAVGIPRPSRLPGPDETIPMGDANLGLELPDSIVGYEIDSLLPVVETLVAATPGNRIRFEMPGLGHITSSPLTMTVFKEAALTHDIVVDLYRMQEVTGSVLRFPANVTDGDVKDLRNTVRQLDGETVDHDGGLTLTLRPEAVAAFLKTYDSVEGDTPGAFMYSAELMELRVGDLRLEYGPAAFYAPLPRLTNRADLEAAAESPPTDGGVDAFFEPTETPFKWLSRADAIEHLEAAKDRDDPPVT